MYQYIARMAVLAMHGFWHFLLAPMVSATVALLKSNYPCINSQITERITSNQVLNIKDIFGQHESIYCKPSCPENSSLSIINTCVCNAGYSSWYLNGRVTCNRNESSTPVSNNNQSTSNQTVSISTASNSSGTQV